jgi:thermostable 8-oxoguanine DNA glycosylase
VNLKAVTELLSQLKEGVIEKTADEIQDEFEEHGFSISSEKAAAIKNAPRDVVSPTHIINLLLQDSKSDKLLMQLMFQIIDTDKLRKFEGIDVTEYYSWSMQKQAIGVFDSLILNIDKNPKG